MDYKELYDENYYKQYDVGVDKVDYEDSEYTKNFLEGIAEKIVTELNPHSVLDVGCAMGHLVKALRDRNVEAYGIDVSEFAISKVDDSIKAYCKNWSATDSLPTDFPQRYDLVVTIEVAEHLKEEDTNAFMDNLCSYSDTVLFSSTPDDDYEPTHFNVQPEEYWLKKFGERNYFNEINNKPVYLTYHAKVFNKEQDFLAVVLRYERKIVKTSEELQSKELQLQGLNSEMQSKDMQIQTLNGDIQGKDLQIQNQTLEIQRINECVSKKNAEIEEVQCKLETSEIENDAIKNQLSLYQKHYNDAILQRDSLQANLLEVSRAYDTMENSACWKVTKPIRFTLDGIKGVVKLNKPLYLSYKGIKCFKENGLKYTWSKIKGKLSAEKTSNEMKTDILFDVKELERQRKQAFQKQIKFSVLVPLYNTPQNFLREMIESVQTQTYSNWELCLADGSDEQHKFVREIVQGYQKKDKRILYKKLEKNRGISENTNACIEMASGQYLCLFDHDDILHPSALYECMKAIEEKNADFIYTDENTFSDKTENAYCPHYKPDYAPDTLRSYNYICHFSVFSKDLLDKVGIFRAEFDGSQDYDIILRLTEIAKTIVHIPQILYYWRSHETSVASDVSAKPYTMIAAKKALKEHLQRVGLEGEIEDSRVLSTYRIKYRIQGEPLVSILIPNKDHKEDLEKCINSILERSTYKNYEIIIIENNSELPETFNYYKELCENERVTMKMWTGKFNYSAINNFGAGFAKGQYLLLLNNDVEIITPQWIEEMLMFTQREDVGIVGAMLYYPDDTVQHGGVIMGIGGIAGHAHKYFKRNDYGYMSRLTIAQNLSCVTGACLMISKNLFETIDGMDESLEVAFNDVDLCVRVRQEGYLIVWTPYAELYHHESKSRGTEDTKQKQERFSKEVLYFKKKWDEVLPKVDPYYNPNLTLKQEDYSCAIKEV